MQGRLEDAAVQLLYELEKLRDEIRKNESNAFGGNTLPAYIPKLPESETKLLIEDSKSRDERIESNERRKQLDSEKSKRSLLEEKLANCTKEINDIIYPKYLNFGYFSFVIFAILGVIIFLASRRE